MSGAPETATTTPPAKAAAPAPPGAPAKAPAKAPAPRSALDAEYQAWERKVAGMRSECEATDWSGVDWSKLRAQDVGVQLGPPMTEEQFRAYRARAGGRVSVVRR